MRAPIEVVRIPVLDDNYIWLLHDSASGDTVVVDPALADPVLAAATARGWRIGQVWNTHWHDDHVAGNAAIRAATGADIVAPAAEWDRIPAATRAVRGGDHIAIGDFTVEVWDVAGHTLGHIAFHLPRAAMIFVGDTLFAMGCGRLFEGDADLMWANMRRLAALPDATRVYCAHEYTLANAHFAAEALPGDAAIATRLADVTAMRASGLSTVPTSIGAEKATNPFLRADAVAEFARLRHARDTFTMAQVRNLAMPADDSNSIQ